MVCEHLTGLEQAIASRGLAETYRGRAWSANCREWVYFDAYLDTERIRRSIALPDCVVDHAHRGTHDGQERGFVCTRCHDAIMGHYAPSPAVPTFDGVES